MMKKNDNSVKITMLGTGRSGCDDGKAQQSILIEYADIGIMIDCGATTHYMLKNSDINYDRIDYIFITHYHIDHILGVPLIMHDFIKNPDIPKRNKPLKIIGKYEVKEKIDSIYRVLSKPFEFEFAEYFNIDETDINLQLPKGIKVECYPMPHKDESLAYVFDFDGKKITVTGDTDWCDTIYELADKSDVMFIECSMLEDLTPTKPKHVSFDELSENLHRLNCQKIIAVHTFQPVIDKINELNSSNLFYYDDGEVITV